MPCIWTAVAVLWRWENRFCIYELYKFIHIVKCSKIIMQLPIVNWTDRWSYVIVWWRCVGLRVVLIFLHLATMPLDWYFWIRRRQSPMRSNRNSLHSLRNAIWRSVSHLFLSNTFWQFLEPFSILNRVLYFGKLCICGELPVANWPTWRISLSSGDLMQFCD